MKAKLLSALRAMWEGATFQTARPRRSVTTSNIMVVKDYRDMTVEDRMRMVA